MAHQAQNARPKKFSMAMPVVTRERLNVGKPDQSYDSLSRDDLKELLDDPMFESIYSDDYERIIVSFMDVMETDEQMKLRVEQEEAALADYHRLKAEHELEMKELKQIDNQKYKDPEYIEFLRMKAKLKSKGIGV